MGVNLFPYVLKERIEDPYGKYFDKERFEEFDSLRYAGDRDFICSDIEWLEELDNPEGRSLGEVGQNFSRPADIDEAIRWIENNISENRQKRLIDLMEEMKKNENLYIYPSF